MVETNGAAYLPEAVDEEARRRINFAWMVKLRWGAVAAQITVIIVVHWALQVRLPLLGLFGLGLITVASNLAFSHWECRVTRLPEWAVPGVVTLDLLLLTSLLQLTGGPENPFVFLYLIHIALGALVVPGRWAWALFAVSCGCFGLLYLAYRPLQMQGGGPLQLTTALHMRGLAVGYASAALFITYSMQRITSSLRARERELRQTREASARNDRLSSLATLAAGAAHELATPLATIAVVAKELQRHLEQSGASDDAMQDARLIRGQVDRCRDVLNHMARDAGQSSGEPITDTSVREIIDAALEGLPHPERLCVNALAEHGFRDMVVPVRSVAQALRAVLHNAIDASPVQGKVMVEASAEPQHWRVTVTDHGLGMAPEVLARVGEPFFTTKAPGQGMGLGLFISRTDLRRIGGDLQIDSVQGSGTSVMLFLPRRQKRCPQPPAPGETTGWASQQEADRGDARSENTQIRAS